jgi:hypothetical protein
MSCVVALALIFVVIMTIALVGCGCAYRTPIESFANGMYDSWKKQLEAIKISHDIGAPSGFMGTDPNATECNTDQNLMIQSNVAFRPNGIRGGGCTYVQKNYPVA